MRCECDRHLDNPQPLRLRRGEAQLGGEQKSRRVETGRHSADPVTVDENRPLRVTDAGAQDHAAHLTKTDRAHRPDERPSDKGARMRFGADDDVCGYLELLRLVEVVEPERK